MNLFNLRINRNMAEIRGFPPCFEREKSGGLLEDCVNSAYYNCYFIYFSLVCLRL